MTQIKQINRRSEYDVIRSAFILFDLRHLRTISEAFYDIDVALC